MEGWRERERERKCMLLDADGFKLLPFVPHQAWSVHFPYLSALMFWVNELSARPSAFLFPLLRSRLRCWYPGCGARAAQASPTLLLCTPGCLRACNYQILTCNRGWPCAWSLLLSLMFLCLCCFLLLFWCFFPSVISSDTLWRCVCVCAGGGVNSPGVYRDTCLQQQLIASLLKSISLAAACEARVSGRDVWVSPAGWNSALWFCAGTFLLPKVSQVRQLLLLLLLPTCSPAASCTHAVWSCKTFHKAPHIVIWTCFTSIIKRQILYFLLLYVYLAVVEDSDFVIWYLGNWLIKLKLHEDE